MNASKYRLIQWVEMSNGLIWVIISLIIGLFSIYLFQSSEHGGGLYIGSVMGSIFCFEAGWYWAVRHQQLKNVLSYTPPDRLSAKLGAALGWGILVMGVLKAAVVSVLFIAAGYVLIRYIDFSVAGLSKPWPMVFLATLILYGIFRPLLKRFAARMMKPVIDWFVGAYPVYSIDAKGLTLHLGQGFPKEKQQIPVLFSELDDIRIFSRFECLAFQKYMIGPDIRLGVCAATDKIAYLAGKIPRPHFFDYLSCATGTRTLFLAGPSLMYFVGLSKQTGDDLLEAFDRQK